MGAKNKKPDALLAFPDNVKCIPSINYLKSYDLILLTIELIRQGKVVSVVGKSSLSTTLSIIKEAIPDVIVEEFKHEGEIIGYKFSIKSEKL